MNEKKNNNGNENYHRSLVQLGSRADDAHGAGTADSLRDTALVLGREASLFP